MSDEREVRPGFLPPRAPGAPPPRRRGPDAPGGWTPPRPPGEGAHRPEPPSSPGRPTFVAPSASDAPSSPVAVVAIVLGSVSIALLFVSVGVAYQPSALMAAVSLGLGLTVRRRLAAGVPGRPGQARAAVVVASIALGLAVMAAIIWIGLESSGFTPEDLQRWLEDELERRRSRPRVTGEPA